MTPFSYGQHVVYIQNNTALDYNFQVVQTGNITLDTSQYMILSTVLTAYANGMAMLEFEPDTIMSSGDTVDFDGILSSGADTIILQMRLVAGNAGNEVFYSGASNSFDLAWYNDLNFHSDTFSMQGDPFTFKFKAVADLSDLDADVGFAIQEDFIYSIDSTDLNDPNLINILSYNIQMTPLVSSDFFERATYFPPLISPYQDVVVYQELFEDMTRINNMDPGMIAAGFPYSTTVLNDTSLSYITSPTNGGVIIYSRWPIEAEAEIKYASCSNNGAFDCLASKGVKYARINKLGKLYHIFGTHMEAGGSAADIQIRLEQYGEIANFMDSMNIPTTEPVIFCGDFNTGPKDGVEYDDIRNLTNPIIPLQVGYYESTFSYQDTGKIIDHAWGQADHLHPIESFNKLVTFRSVDSVMWNIYDFSDHRTCIARFVYPDILPDAFVDTSLCATESMTLDVGASAPFSFQWMLNGTNIPGANSSTYTILSPSSNTAGNYACELTSTDVYGYQGDLLTQIFFPEGPDTLVQNLNYPMAIIGFQEPCILGMEDVFVNTGISIVPSPNNGQFEVRLQTFVGDEVFELYNSRGRLVSRRVAESNSSYFDISNLPMGVYLLRASGSTGSHTSRIIFY